MCRYLATAILLLGLLTDVHAASGTCFGNCDDNSMGTGNDGSPPGLAGQPGGPLPSGTSTNNGNDNGNCKGNCVGNRNGNNNGNNNVNSSNNGNKNGNCDGNCFFNQDGNVNGNNNTNVDNNGNNNGNCRGNCFYRVAGNNNGNNNNGPVRDEEVIGFLALESAANNNLENCEGNCFDPQPMGRQSSYVSNFEVLSSPLNCRATDGYTYYIIPGSYCLEIYRATSYSATTYREWTCPPGTVMDLDICTCNHWYMTNLFNTCRSSFSKFG